MLINNRCYARIYTCQPGVFLLIAIDVLEVVLATHCAILWQLIYSIVLVTENWESTTRRRRVNEWVSVMRYVTHKFHILILIRVFVKYPTRVFQK